MSPYRVAELIQSRFIRDEEGNIIGCRDRYMSDILGSDWGSGKNYHQLNDKEYYSLVYYLAEKKHGVLPF